MKLRSCVPAPLLFAIFILASLSQLASATASQVTLTFYMLTASHAAVGAPMQYQITLTNTGTTSCTLTDVVNLIDPNSTTYNLLTSNPTLAPGQVLGTSGTFNTSNFSSLTGNWSLQAFTLDSTGHMVMSKTTPLSVVPVPANGIYGSIGGRGPASGQVGLTYDFSTVVANLGASSSSLQTQAILTLSDGVTQEIVKPGSPMNFNAGTNVITPITVTTSQFTGKSGNFTVTLNVLDSSGNLLSTDASTFSRSALPKGFLAAFKDLTTAGINAPRTPPTLPPGCGGFADFNPGNSGAAIADYDGDGFEDIFVAGEFGDNHLWHNNHNGTYTDMASSAGIPLTATASVSGSTFADIDNDGHPDLLLLGGPQAQNILLHNNGNGTFTDISATSGLQGIGVNNFGASWGDYDNDGFLDVVIVDHADCSGNNSGVHLYHNNQNLTFTEVTSFLGTTKISGRGLTALFVDYNQDGRVDLMVGNDQGTNFGANVLWRNDGPNGSGGWTFTDVSASSGFGIGMAAMGMGVGDYNRDGQYDIYLNNFANSPNPANNILLAGSASGVFLQNQGDQQGGAHAKRATVPCLSPPGGQAASVTWGGGFMDFNNDGWDDIWMAGSGAGANGCTEIQDNTTVLFNLKGTYLDLGGQASLRGPATAGSSPAAVFTDFNNDGFMDVFQAPSNGLEHLYVNQGISGGITNSWLQVKLVGTVSNRDAVGARLVASVGGVNLVKTVFNGGTYQGNSTLIQQFGLGTSTQADTLTIYWPSGMVQTLTNVAGNQRMTITEP
ncbi:MAG TPA: CRTAC1 family protein [Terriglobales bacterium]|nr:CRTAC1 family protein [Terriglobales bacterium]